MATLPLVGRSVIAWMLGMVGPVGSVLGWGTGMMPAAGQQRALLVLGGSTAVWVAVAAVALGRFPGGQLVAAAGALATAVPLAASGVGRVPAVVAVSSVVVGVAALVDWQPVPGTPPRASRTVPSALVALAVGEWVWVEVHSFAVTLIAFAVSLLVTDAHHRPGSPVLTAEAALRRTAGASAQRLRDVAAATPAVVRRFRSRLSARVERSTVPPDVRRAMLVGGLVALAFAPVFWRLVNVPGALSLGVNDHGLHVEAAHRFSLIPFRLEVPQFLFHVVTAALSEVVGEAAGPVVTLTVAMWATYLAVFGLLRRSPSAGQRGLDAVPARVVAALVLFVETPTLLLIMADLVGPNTRFLSVHVLYSPTWVVALPFALYTLALLDDAMVAAATPVEVRTPAAIRRSRSILGAVVAVGTMAKPSFTLCLVPALPIYAVLFARSSLRRLIGDLVWVAVPGVIVVAWQTWFLSTSSSALGSDGFTFDPIAGPVYGWSQVRLPFGVPMLGLLVVATAVSRGAFLRERLVRLVLCCFAVALPIFVLFKETGPRAQHGNLGVPAQVCVTMLAVLAIRRITSDLLVAPDAPGRPPQWVRVAAGALLLAFLGGGILSYLDALGLVHVPISWFPFY